MCQKINFVLIESWIFNFDKYFFYSRIYTIYSWMQLLGFNGEVFEVIAISQVLEFKLDENQLLLKYSSSLILTTYWRLRIEPYMVNLIWKWLSKVSKKQKEHLIMNFWVKNSNVKTKMHNKCTYIWILQSCGFCGIRGYDLWSWYLRR